MKKLLCLFLVLAAAATAQTAESLSLQGVMLPTNEVPAIRDLDARGFGALKVSIVRNSAGEVVSGSVNFVVNYAFPGAVTVTGLHIHPGAAGVNGPAIVSSGIAGGAPVVDAGGRGTIDRTGNVLPTDQAGLAVLAGLTRDPSQYYVNLHTSVYGGGAIRAQLVNAPEAAYIGRMSPANEVPAIDLNASGLGMATVRIGRDALGLIVAAEATFYVDYRFPSQVTFTGLHIHDGAAGINGPVRLSSALPTPMPSTASGVGTIRRTVEIPVTTPEVVATLESLSRNPENHYINLHTTVFPGGVIRSQLRATDVMTFSVLMSPANEVPAIDGLDATAAARVLVRSIRAADGSIAVAGVTFDVNHRFPGAAEFTGLHIHDGAAGVLGPVRVSSGLAAFTSATGIGNIDLTQLFAEGDGLATLNSLIRNPENHYLNLHTRVNPGGAVRAPMAAASTALPNVVDVISGVSDPALRTGGQGGLMTVFGRDLFKVPGDNAGFEPGRVPLGINGTEITVGGRAAPILFLGREPRGDPPDFAVIQIPFETAAGNQAIVVRSSNGDGRSFTTPVAAVAPGVFFDATAGIALRVSDLSLIRPENPARAGDTIAVIATGLGQTFPALATGQFAPALPPAATVTPVSATLGGREALVAATYAVPGFTGLYACVIVVTPGLPAGNLPLVLRSGTATANTVLIPVR